MTTALRFGHLEHLKLSYLCNASSDPLHIWFYVGFFWGQQIEWRYFRLNQIQDGNSESTEYWVDERRDNNTQPVECCEHCR